VQGEAWATVGVGLTTLGGIAGAWLAGRAQTGRVEAKVDTAADIAAVAAENTRHVRDGFATRTTDGIGQLLDGQARLEEALQRLAIEHGRTVGRLDHAIERLDRHLDPPAHGRDVTKEGDG